MRPRDALARSVLAALAVSAVGCVLPVAPEFEDPEPNVPPFVWSADPPEGSVISSVGDTASTIKVWLADPNLGDELHVRWVFDYPPQNRDSRLVEAPTLPPSPRGSLVRGTVELTPNCLRHNIAAGSPSHRLYLIVADRPFNGFYEGVPTGAYVVHASWIVNLECP